MWLYAEGWLRPEFQSRDCSIVAPVTFSSIATRPSRLYCTKMSPFKTNFKCQITCRFYESSDHLLQEEKCRNVDPKIFLGILTIRGLFLPLCRTLSSFEKIKILFRESITSKLIFEVVKNWKLPALWILDLLRQFLLLRGIELRIKNLRILFSTISKGKIKFEVDKFSLVP